MATLSQNTGIARRIAALGATMALVVTMLVAIAPRPAAAADCHPYPDVDSSNVHCQNIAWLKDQNITKPSDGRYHPAASVNRGAMAAFLFRLTHPGEPSPTCTKKPFPDVTTSNVFCGYIKWAAESGIAYGYGDDTYRPDNPVTRGAMAAYLYRIVNPRIGAPDCSAAPFDDVAKSDVFCGVITWMANNGITYGIAGTDNYGQRASVTRQAMASFLRRMPSITLVNEAVKLHTDGFRGNDDINVRVELVQVIEPMSGHAPAGSGDHYAGMLLRVKNLGPDDFAGDPHGSVHGVDSHGTTHPTVHIFSSDLGESIDPLVTGLEPGNTVTGWVAVELANGRHLSSVTYKLEFGQAGHWNL